MILYWVLACTILNELIPIAYMKDNLACVIKRGKDKTKLLDNVNLVYKIKCNDCP